MNSLLSISWINNAECTMHNYRNALRRFFSKVQSAISEALSGLNFIIKIIIEPYKVLIELFQKLAGGQGGQSPLGLP